MLSLACGKHSQNGSCYFFFVKRTKMIITVASKQRFV